MKSCDKNHERISWGEDFQNCPLCVTINAWNREARSDADYIRNLKTTIHEMKEKCICGKLAE